MWGPANHNLGLEQNKYLSSRPASGLSVGPWGGLMTFWFSFSLHVVGCLSATLFIHTFIYFMYHTLSPKGPQGHREGRGTDLPTVSFPCTLGTGFDHAPSLYVPWHWGTRMLIMGRCSVWNVDSQKSSDKHWMGQSCALLHNVKWRMLTEGASAISLRHRHLQANGFLSLHTVGSPSLSIRFDKLLTLT